MNNFKQVSSTDFFALKNSYHNWPIVFGIYNPGPPSTTVYYDPNRSNKRKECAIGYVVHTSLEDKYFANELIL